MRKPKMETKPDIKAKPQEETPEEELDLGLDQEPEDSEEPEEPEQPEKQSEYDMEAALQRLKPDFRPLIEILGLQPQGSSQEEIEQDLIDRQAAFEQYLQNTIVRKVRASLEAKMSQSPRKPGTPVQTQPTRQRKTTPFA